MTPAAQAAAAIERAIEQFAQTPADALLLRQQFGIVATCSAIDRVDRIKASAVAQGIAV